MRVVLDTNILVVSITSNSPYHKIFTSLLHKQYDLIVSTSIVFEYREVIQEKYGEKTAALLVELLDELSNVHYANPSFRWNFIYSTSQAPKGRRSIAQGEALCIDTNQHIKL